MKTNDRLLTYFLELDEKQKGRFPVLIEDEIHYNPETLNVGANETVYLHFIKSNRYDFELKVETATQSVNLDRKNTQWNASNLILKATSDIRFSSEKQTDFYVQLLRVHY